MRRRRASTRAIIAGVPWLGAALLAGAAVPAARCSRTARRMPASWRNTFAAFAPGLIGYGLSNPPVPVLFADARTRVAPWPWWPAGCW